MQDDLFPSDDTETIDIAFSGEVVGQLQLYDKAFINEADDWFHRLSLETPWQQDQLCIANKIVQVPRLQCWYGGPSAYYQYSGLRLSPQAWTPLLLEIKQCIEDLSAQQFNSALINYYRHGEDSVSWHADDEVELGKNPIIASLSLGQHRCFSIKSKHVKAHSLYKLDLKHGDLLVMGEGIQQHCLHAVLKDSLASGPRINVTFRNIIG